MSAQALPIGTRVKMDAAKFTKLVDIVFLVSSEPRLVVSGDDKGRSFVWLVTEDTASLSKSRQRTRTAWTTDIAELV